MKLQNPIILIWNALLRPSRFAAFLALGWRQVIYAACVTLLWTVTLLACINLLVGQIIPLGPHRVVLGIVFPIVVVLPSMNAGFLFMNKSNQFNMLWFWLLRPQIAITPSFAPLISLAFSPGLGDGTAPWSIWLVYTLILVFSYHAGSFLGLGFAGVVRPAASLALRATAILMAIAVGLLSWWSPQLVATNLRLVSLIMAGLALNILRPLTWLCEAPVSLGLRLCGPSRLSIDQLRRWHPTSYDELILLPLPGLRALLMHACSSDLPRGIAWLLAIAAHPGQHPAAYAALRRLIEEGALAHTLLLSLSNSTAGRAVLREASARPGRTSSLIWAYVTLAEIREPGAWIEQIDGARSAIAAWPHVSGTPDMLRLLASSSAILHADRWERAVVALESCPVSSNRLDEIAGCCSLLDYWLEVATADIRTGAGQLAELVKGAKLPIGWAASLLATVGEHLCFLVSVEHRRMEAQPDVV